MKIYTNSLALQIVWETNVSIMHKQTTKFLQIQRNVRSVKRKKLLGLHCECALTCGHVGCCDSSVGLHATKHFKETGHPVMIALPSKSWKWCYIHEEYC